MRSQESSIEVELLLLKTSDLISFGLTVNEGFLACCCIAEIIFYMLLPRGVVKLD